MLNNILVYTTLLLASFALNAAEAAPSTEKPAQTPPKSNPLALAGLSGGNTPSANTSTAGTQYSASNEDPGKAERQRRLREKFLDHFTLGVDAPYEWFQDVEKRQGCAVDAKVSYLSGEVGDGQPVYWQKMNWFVEGSLKDAEKNKQVVWWTFYLLAASAPQHYKPGPAQASPLNAKVPKTMREYFDAFKYLMESCGKRPNATVVVQIEPDEWGHLLIGAGFDPAKEGTVMVKSSGHPDLKDLPDNIIGWAKAFKLLRDKYAPQNVLLCANPSQWAAEGAMSAKKWAEYFKPMGVYEWELAVLQFHDGDQGRPGNGERPPPYTEKQLVTYFGSWDKQLRYIDEFHRLTGLWVCFWQVPVGNYFFKTCDNSKLHGTDGLCQALLEDYPKNDLIARMAAAGCCGWMFHGSNNESSHVYDAAKDGITNPTAISGSLGNTSEYADDDGGYFRLRAASYYKNPLPIMGKPKPVPAAANKSAAIAPKAPVVPKSTLKLKDPSVLAAKEAELRKAIQSSITDSRKPRFLLAAFKETATITALDEAGKMALQLNQGGKMDYAWEMLKPSEKALIAQGMAREEQPEENARAAFFILIEGDAERAQKYFEKAPGLYESVMNLFMEIKPLEKLADKPKESTSK